MNEYELTMVLPGGVSVSKKKAAGQLIEKLLEMVKGKIKKSKDWGEIDLSYEIKKNNSGVFLHFILELESRNVGKISDKLKLEDTILRYLIVKREEKSKGK